MAVQMTTNKDGTTVYTDVTATNKTPTVPQTPTATTEDIPKSMGVNALTGNEPPSLQPPVTQPSSTQPPPVQQPTLPQAYTPRPETKVAPVKTTTEPAVPKTLGAQELVALNKKTTANKTAADIMAAQKKTSQTLGQQGLAHTSIAGEALSETDLAALAQIENDKASLASQQIAVDEQLRKEGIANLDTILGWAADGKIDADSVGQMIDAAQSGDWAKVAQIYKDNAAAKAEKPAITGEFAADDTAGVAAKVAEYKQMGGSAITIQNADGSWSVKPLMIVGPDGTKHLAIGADELANLKNQYPNKKIKSTYNAADNTVTYEVTDETFDATKQDMTLTSTGEVVYTDKPAEPEKPITTADYWKKVNSGSYDGVTASTKDDVPTLKTMYDMAPDEFMSNLSKLNLSNLTSKDIDELEAGLKAGKSSTAWNNIFSNPNWARGPMNVIAGLRSRLATNNPYVGSTPNSEIRLKDLKTLLEGEGADDVDLLLDYFTLTGGKTDVQGLKGAAALDDVFTEYAKKQGENPLNSNILSNFINGGSTKALTAAYNLVTSGKQLDLYNLPKVKQLIKDNTNSLSLDSESAFNPSWGASYDDAKANIAAHPPGQIITFNGRPAVITASNHEYNDPWGPSQYRTYSFTVRYIDEKGGTGSKSWKVEY